MDLEILKEFEGKKTRIVLRNGFFYNAIIFSVTKEGLIRFKDLRGDDIILDASQIVLLSPAKPKKKEEDIDS